MGHPSNIPLTPQTDERSFPTWDAKATYGRSGHPYPKMLSREFMPEDVEPWQQANKRHDKVNGDYWENRCPKARKVLANGKVVPGDLVPLLSNQDMVDAGYTDTVGLPVTCRDAKEEEEIRKILGLPSIEEEKKASSVSALVQSDNTEAELQRLRRQNEELEAQLERNVALNKKIREEREERVELKAAVKPKAKPAPEPVKKRGRPKGSTNKPKVFTSLGDEA